MVHVDICDDDTKSLLRPQDKGRCEAVHALEFLGVVIDARAGSVYLPKDKREVYRAEKWPCGHKYVEASCTSPQQNGLL